MILTIDIGNTNMEFGIFHQGILQANFRLGTNRDITSDEIGLLATQFFNIHKIDPREVRDIIISSVVPQVMYSINNAMRKYFNKEPLIVGENLPIKIENKYDNKKEVGADRLVNSYSAIKKYGTPLIIVDFGTATTFDVVDKSGAYLGGVIYPGIKISMDALFKNAAKLPKVELNQVDSVIGKNTINSMQAGAIYGYIGAVKNIVSAIEDELGEKTKIIATGGLATYIDDFGKIFEKVDKTLTLDGLRMIYKEYKNEL